MLVPLVVWVEASWVLDRAYGVDRRVVARVLTFDQRAARHPGFELLIT